MVFDNIRLSNQNACFGPVSGRVYSFDYASQALIVKTFPGGTLVSTIPTDTPLEAEIVSSEFDGYFFFALNRIPGSVGVRITKWKINGAILEKQTGISNEIVLVNNISNKYDSDAFTVQIHKTSLAFSYTAAATTIQLLDTTFAEINDAIYIGPSTASLGEVVERRIIGVSGNLITLNAPLGVNFNVTDQVIYRKNIWVFNNKSGNTDTGSVLQVSTLNGSILSSYTGTEWKNVVAATCHSGDLLYVRGLQVLRYRPFGINAGFQSSAILQNTKNDNNTVIRVYDLLTDSTNLYKLQKERVVFNGTTFVWDEETSLTNKYEVDTEQIAPKVFSITGERIGNSVLLGSLVTSDIRIKVKDQYNTPILGRAFSIQENDASGLISIGFTSFTTDVNGEGLTRYSTGSNPDFSDPIITAIDVGTQHRSTITVNQKKNIENKNNVTQVNSITTRTIVEQIKKTSQGYLEQYGLKESKTPVEQLSPSYKVQLVQDNLQRKYVIEQKPLITATMPVTQLPLIEESINVTQYDFLIFAIPEPYSQKNSPDTNILVRIIGFGSIPLNASSLIFKINGIDVTSSVVVTPFGGGLQLDYNPPVDFDYASIVSVDIEIEDTDVPVKTIKTFYTFGIVDDYKKPIFEQFFPPNNSINNLKLTEVYAIVKDSETDLDISKIKMYVDGIEVNPTISNLGSETYKISYQTLNPYIYQSEVYASILIEDIRGNRDISSWSFFIEPSAGVLFKNIDPKACSSLVPVDTNICFEAFGQEDGINFSSLNFIVEGKNITYILKPKVYIKE